MKKELYEAISNSENATVNEIVSNNPELLEIQTPLGSWLQVAAMHGNIEVINLLLEKGFDVNESGKIGGGNPLTCAAVNGHLETVDYLIKNGAVIETDLPEKNPLFSAIYGDHIEVVKYLLEAGIDLSITYHNSKTALTHARDLERSDIVEYLEGLQS